MAEDPKLILPTKQVFADADAEDRGWKDIGSGSVHAKVNRYSTKYFENIITKLNCYFLDQREQTLQANLFSSQDLQSSEAPQACLWSAK